MADLEEPTNADGTEPDADEAEREAAAAFARALDGEAPRSATDPHAPELEIAQLVRAAAGRAAPLGELRARGLARAAVEEARRGPIAAEAAANVVQPVQRRRSARRWVFASFGMAAAFAVVAGLALGTLSSRNARPPRLLARSAGLLVPGPFPAEQTAAQRLDVVTADRLVAFREHRARSAAGRGRR